MGFIAPPSGMLQGMPLCEIENFRTMEGDTGFGNISILATIRVVGRATLLDVQTPDGEISEGYLTGWCAELSDDMTNNSDGDLIDVYNELANKCEDLFESIISLQETILALEEEKQKEAMEESGSGDKEVLSEATLKRMKLEAELGLDDDEDDDDDDDYLDDYDYDSGTRSAFEKAFHTAKASDTQGYTILSSISNGDSGVGESSSSSTTSTTKTRSIQELTALSWAYLSKDVWGEEDDEENTLLKYRLQALNTVDLSDRLILASELLIEQKKKLVEKREKL